VAAVPSGLTSRPTNNNLDLDHDDDDDDDVRC
jgi:hypothetical protein